MIRLFLLLVFAVSCASDRSQPARQVRVGATLVCGEQGERGIAFQGSNNKTRWVDFGQVAATNCQTASIRVERFNYYRAAALGTGTNQSEWSQILTNE